MNNKLVTFPKKIKASFFDIRKLEKEPAPIELTDFVSWFLNLNSQKYNVTEWRKLQQPCTNSKALVLSRLMFKKF